MRQITEKNSKEKKSFYKLMKWRDEIIKSQLYDFPS